MKGHKNLLIIISMALVITILTGCTPKREELTFKGEEGTIVFNVKKKANYKIYTNDGNEKTKQYFRTSREQGVLVGDGFKIGIEFDDDFDYFFNSSFENIKEARKEYPSYKEVTYGDFEGVQYFYGGYNRYEIMLPCGDSQRYFLSLTVYGDEENETSANKAINNEELLDVLNNIKSIKSVK